MASSGDSVDLQGLQRAAEEAGRRCVVGALIVRDGTAFVHLRGPDRSFLPSCWDIPGGHVEPGETLLEALTREVDEETGWQVTGQPTLFHVANWQTDPHDDRTGRREFDFLVTVEGNLDRPRLETPKQVDFRWIKGTELDLLDLNRGRDGGLIRSLVELALSIA